MLAILLLVFGIATRFITHEPNFTPVTAIALFGGVYLTRKYAILLPLALMMLSDIVIGTHDTMLFTWGSFALIAMMGLWVRNHKSPATIVGSSTFLAILFFIITNFGVWLAGSLYPPTAEGLSSCFIAAVPFFRNTLLSSLGYSLVLFGSYELIAHRVKNTRFARALLTV